MFWSIVILGIIGFVCIAACVVGDDSDDELLELEEQHHYLKHYNHNKKGYEYRCPKCGKISND